MKFTIEIYGANDDGLESLLNRTTVSAIAPLGARKDAHRLLAEWKRRGATTARVLNAKGDTIYKLTSKAASSDTPTNTVHGAVLVRRGESQNKTAPAV